MIRRRLARTCWWLTASLHCQGLNSGGMVGGEAFFHLVSGKANGMQLFFYFIFLKSLTCSLWRHQWLIMLTLLCSVELLLSSVCTVLIRWSWFEPGTDSGFMLNNLPREVWNPLWSHVRCPECSATPLPIFPLIEVSLCFTQLPLVRPPDFLFFFFFYYKMLYNTCLNVGRQRPILQ